MPSLEIQIEDHKDKIRDLVQSEIRKHIHDYATHDAAGGGGDNELLEGIASWRAHPKVFHKYFGS
jgi:hypothetical protein